MKKQTFIAALFIFALMSSYCAKRAGCPSQFGYKSKGKKGKCPSPKGDKKIKKSKRSHKSGLFPGGYKKMTGGK